MVDKSPPSPFPNAQMPLSASEERDRNIKAQIEKERAQTDAKTARLKALRLANEAADKAAAPAPAPPAAKRKRMPQR